MTIVLPTISCECTYVAPATLLPSHLRARASVAHLCYFQIVDHATNAERLFVRVSALPHRLDELDSSRVFTVCLSSEQLAQAVSWDRAMQARPTCEVRELVECHARQVCGNTLSLPEVSPIVVSAPAQQLAEQDSALVALPEVFVSCETVQEVVTEMQTPPNGNAPQHQQKRWERLTWLRAAIAMVRRQLSHIGQLPGTLVASLATLDEAIRYAFVAQHRLHYPLVCSQPVFIDGRQVGWHLLIGVPFSLTQVA